MSAYYEIKITAENGSGKEIELVGISEEGTPNAINCKIKEIHIKVDAEVQEANSRSSKIVNSVLFTIDVDESTYKQCKDLMDWALTSKGMDVYRTVRINVQNENHLLLRSFYFKEMFLDDYNEENSEKGTTFTVKLLQKPGYASEFKNSTTPL